jgi:hypothetical protein
LAPRRLKLSAPALLAANLVPLAGVIFLQWSVSSVIILYWFENVVLGVINVIRMIACSPAEGSIAVAVGAGEQQTAVLEAAFANVTPRAFAHAIKLFLIPFFMLHYFMFCAGHGVFVFSLFPDESGYFAATEGLGLFSSLGRAVEIFSTPLALAAVALALSHGISFLVNFVGGREYQRLDLRQLMMLPYSRIVVLHLTIIFGGFVTMALGEPVWVVVILVLIKTGVDLKMHLKEHVRADGA